MNKTLYVGLFASFFAAAGFGAFGLATAEEPDFRDGIYISEINWAGSAASGSDEWIEITNRSGESVDFSGWMLDNAATAGETLLIKDEIVVEDGATLLIANYKNTNDKSSLLIEPDLITSSLSLTNSNLAVTLRNASGDAVDEADLGSGAPDFGGSDPFASAIRTADGWVTADESVNLPEGQFGTPGEIDMVAEVVEEDEETVVSCPTLEQLLAEQAVENDTEEENGTSDVEITGEETGNTDLGDEDDSVEDSDMEDEKVICTCAQDSEAENEANEAEEDVAEADDANASDEDVESVSEEEAVATGDQNDIVINEFVSDPTDGGEEWVELYNAGSDEVSLEGMYLIDASGRKTALEGSIAAGSFAVIESPKGQLNNGGDLVEIRNASDSVIDSVTYGGDVEAPEDGESLARQNGEFYLTNTPTPGEENVITYDSTNTGADSEDAAADQGATDSESAEESGEEVSETSSTSDELLSDDGQEVNQVSSVVTVPPGVLGKQIMYVNGYQVYMHSADWPDLNAGDVVDLAGEAYEARGEMRFKISSAEDVQVTGAESVEAMNLADSSDWQHGSLAAAEGLVTERESDRLVLEFGENSIQVILSPKTELKTSSLLTDYARVTGVLRNVDGEWKLYPFSESHLESVESLAENESGANEAESIETEVQAEDVELPIAGIGLFTGSVGALGYWFTKSLTT